MRGEEGLKRRKKYESYFCLCEKRKESAVVLFDLFKCYETIAPEVLLAEARAHGFPRRECFLQPLSAIATRQRVGYVR